MRLPGVGFCATRVLNMRLLMSSPTFRSLLAVPFLAAMLAFPASAETNPEAAAPKAEAGAEAAKADSNAPVDPNAPPAEPNAVDTAAPAAAAAPEKPKSTVLINIDKSSQEMTVFVDGVETYSWPVSTGRPEYATPSGNYKPTSMNEMWYSKQWDNSPMPHSIFFTDKGHAIHGSYDVKRLGRPASHGCVRLSPAHAAILFSLVRKSGLSNTKVVLNGGRIGPSAIARAKLQRVPAPEAAPPEQYSDAPAYADSPSVQPAE